MKAKLVLHRVPGNLCADITLFANQDGDVTDLRQMESELKEVGSFFINLPSGYRVEVDETIVV